MKLPTRLHIIGICGVATSALAIALHKKGVKVTGSDKGFFPPISTELEKNGIPFYAGWHPEKMIENGMPESIIIGGGGTSPSNPEIIYAKEHSIPVISFAEAIGKYVIKKNSIVTTGTWGKTTISSILSFILIEAGKDPSYFTGGVSLSHDAAALTNSDWSVVEGDEYQVSISDRRPKFIYYAPTHLLLTSVSWDHADLYPTEESYFKIFEELLRAIPDSEMIVACTDNAGVKKVLGVANKKGQKIITYGKDKKADYHYHSISQTRSGITFSINHKGASYKIESPMLGRFNAENITGCFAMAHSVGIPADAIIKAIKDFKGIKRRFEKRFEGDVTIMDCHAPTPEKAASVLESIREVYDKKIIAVYEPNIGGRQRGSLAKYDNAFKDADIVVIPRLTKLKVGAEPDVSALPIEGPELADIIGKSHSDVHYLEDDQNLIAFLKSNTKKGDIIVFLGSHGFRGMIEETIGRLKIRKP